MTIQNLKSQLGDYAKDIKLNLGSVISEEGAPGLNETQIFATALASAYATQHADVISAFEAEAEDKLSPDDIKAAKAAATIMAMNNIYYRFVHLVSDKDYATLSANLRMQAIGNPGVEKVDFELYSLAVSAINGCGMCIDAHVQQLQKAGLDRAAIQSAIRIASVVHAAAQALIIGN